MRRTFALWLLLAVMLPAQPRAQLFGEETMLEGAWASPSTLGQGLFIDAYRAGNLLFVGWFTYAPGEPSRHLWLTAQLTVNGAIASGPIGLTRGGRFDAVPGPEQQARVVGQMTIDFLDCATARVTYSLVLDGRSDAGSFIAHPLVMLVDPQESCARPTKLRWPHAEPGLGEAEYRALLGRMFALNNFPQLQQSSGGPDDIYFHSGIDVMLPNGTPIHALEPGTVRSVTADGPSGAAVVVQTQADPRAAWGYVHVSPLVAPGQQVVAGQRIGTVRFSGVEHLHLSRLLQPEGSSSWQFADLVAINPIGFFELPDDEPPVFRPELLFLRHGSHERFVDGEPVVVSGVVDIVAGVHDPGPRSRHTFPQGTMGDLHAVAWIEYEIRGEGLHEYHRAFDFLTLEMPGLGNDRGPLARVVYRPLLRVEPAWWWLGVPSYYIVSNGGGPQRLALEQPGRGWHTAALDADGNRRYPDGLYEIVVRAADAAGNISQVGNLVEVRNDAP